MRSMPSSDAGQTRRASFGFFGSPQMPSPVIRIAPKPSRFTLRFPPIRNMPLAFASTLAMRSPVLRPMT